MQARGNRIALLWGPLGSFVSPPGILLEYHVGHFGIERESVGLLLVSDWNPIGNRLGFVRYLIVVLFEPCLGPIGTLLDCHCNPIEVLLGYLWSSWNANGIRMTSYWAPIGNLLES